jgi:hypothetical protein
MTHRQATWDVTYREAGQACYEGFCEAAGWKDPLGNPAPFWRDLEEASRQLWRAAARAAIQEVQELCLRALTALTPTSLRARATLSAA